MRSKPIGRTDEKAGRHVNVSPRLVTYATRVLDHGCPELIAAVESGGFKVSLAARLAGLPRERQIEEIAHGPERAAARARQLVRRMDAAKIGSFGRLPQPGGEQELRYLWVTAESLPLAVQTLQRRGFCFE